MLFPGSLFGENRKNISGIIFRILFDDFSIFFDPRLHILQFRAGQVVDLAEIYMLVPFFLQKVIKSASKLLMAIGNYFGKLF